MNNEIILYQANEITERIEVRLENETVWLNQEQMSVLFQRDQSVISRHIRNVFKEGELDEKSNMQKMHIPFSDKPVTFYNLDVIISVGYRVKSKQGTRFRIWATQVLKEYLLTGYAVNQRIDRVENRVDHLSNEMKEIRLQINTSLPPKQGLFFDGQIFDAYIFVCDLIKSAKKEIILIDNYIDESVLQLLTKRKKKVLVTIYTLKVNEVLQQDLDKHNSQYEKVKIKIFKKSHDRFLIIDERVYHFGASLKDLGKKWFAFSNMQLNANEILEKLN
ncbi:MAG: virulence RhuM family protein [Flavobacteriaceae bacterium]|nr:virulence RhuM family protein [Flavobacteriaceae bacterium]